MRVPCWSSISQSVYPVGMLKTHFYRRAVLAVLILAASTLITAPSLAQETRARYLTIPVEGQIGVDTVPAGFTDAFDRARRDTFTTVLILTFDSEGGSAVDAEAIIKVIQESGDRFKKVGIVKKCIGASLGILLTCDEIYIAEPQPTGTVLEFQAAWAGDSGNVNEELRRQQALYRKLVANKPKWQPVIEAMIDPNKTLYAWQSGPKEISTSNKNPDVKEEVIHIDLSNSLGVSAKEAIAAGLAKQLKGGMAEIGSSLGFERFEPSATKGALVMANSAKERTRAAKEINATIERAFQALSTAQDLVHDLPRQEYFAQQADPRSMEYRSSYVRSWRGNSWRYTNPSLSAWRRNTDNAIKQWQVVVSSLDRIARLGNEARSDVGKLEKHSEKWPADAPQHDGLKLLHKELDRLISQDASLGVMRDQALSEISFLQKNRNNPVL